MAIVTQFGAGGITGYTDDFLFDPDHNYHRKGGRNTWKVL
jgi:hypothetical protein